MQKSHQGKRGEMKLITTEHENAANALYIVGIVSKETGAASVEN